MNVGAVAVSVLAMFGASLAALAQRGTSEVRGGSTDPQESALPGGTLVIRNEATGSFRQTVTDAQGTYFTAGVTHGGYELTAEPHPDHRDLNYCRCCPISSAGFSHAGQNIGAGTFTTRSTPVGTARAARFP